MRHGEHPQRGSASVEQAGLAGLIALLLLAAIAAVAAGGKVDAGRALAGAIGRLDLNGTADQQAMQVRDAIRVLFPEAVTLVREAREGLS